MSVIIELAKSHLLQTQKDNPNFLFLPTFEIKPDDKSNFPHISQIDFSVRGVPQELVKQLQHVYKSLNLGQQNLFKLSKPQKFKLRSCKWDKPLPNDVRCALQVTVVYYESDKLDSYGFSDSIDPVLEKVIPLNNKILINFWRWR